MNLLPEKKIQKVKTGKTLSGLVLPYFNFLPVFRVQVQIDGLNILLPVASNLMFFQITQNDVPELHHIPHFIIIDIREIKSECFGILHLPMSQRGYCRRP